MAGQTLRTIVSVDGFNFYYGAVKGTRWKWLDPAALFSKVLGPRDCLVKFKYFTARVQPTPSDPEVHVRQDVYLRALLAHCPLIQLYFGHFLRHRVLMEHASPPPATVPVWKNEEKGSDVNLALHLLNDAWIDAYDLRHCWIRWAISSSGLRLRITRAVNRCPVSRRARRLPASELLTIAPPACR